MLAQPNAKLDMITLGRFHNLFNYIDTVNTCDQYYPSDKAFCADTTGNRPAVGDTTFYYFSYDGNYDTLYVLSNGAYGPLPQANIATANIFNQSFSFLISSGCNNAYLIVKNLTGRDTSNLMICRNAPDGTLQRIGSTDTVCYQSKDTLSYIMNPVSGSIDSVAWDFGDTAYTTIGFNTSHIFSFNAFGKRIVKATIYDMDLACGSTDFYDTLFVVFNGNITITDSAGCPCNNIILKGVSPIASAFTWTFPDTSMAGSRVHYTSAMPGGKYVSVIGTAANGCIVSATKYLDICPGEYISSESNNVWYFGGPGLNHNTNPPTTMSNGRLIALEGCASVADPFTGQLLFYTNGIYVYDRNHNQMPNGFGLFSHESSSQGALIVPVPGNKNQYYIFTVGGAFGVTTKRLHYSIVDITLNGGMGDVLTKNVQVVPDGPGNSSSEMQAGIQKSSADCDSTDKYWVVSPIELAGVWNFQAYEVTAAGPILKQNNPLTVGAHRHTQIMQSSFSPDGKLYAAGNHDGGFDLFDFDITTGILSNLRHIETGSPSYGLAFSADSKKIYIARFFDKLLQFDLLVPTAVAISASEVKLDSVSVLRGLYRGPDDKIYVNEQGAVGVIHFPNMPGQACVYEKIKYTFSAQYMLMGLQNLVPLYLDTNTTKVINADYSYTQQTCPTHYTSSFINHTDSILPVSTYDPCMFNPRDTMFYEWVYGDGSPRDTFLIVQGGNQQHVHPTHNYPGAGSYNAQLIFWSTFTCRPDTFPQTIVFNAAPAPTVVNPLPYCDSVLVSGTWYYNSQTVMDTLIGAGYNGCDSIVQRNLVIKNSSSVAINPTACSVYTSPAGHVYSLSGTYIDTLSSFNGCDSLITINLSIGSASTHTVSLITCDSIQINNNWYYGSQSINDTIVGGAFGGCDSIVNTLLTLNYSVSGSSAVSACSGQGIVIHGINRTLAGIYTQTFSSASGCDSISSITLNVLPVSISNDTLSNCDSVSYNGTWFTSTQIVNDTLAGSNGCDSILNTHINIINTPVLIVMPAVDTIVKGESITINVSGASTFSWSNGSTTSSIVVTPNSNTTYCVVSRIGDCSDSVCVEIVVIDDECGGELYVPNAFSPNDDGQNDKLCIYGTACMKTITLSIYDRWGELVYSSSDSLQCWDGTYKGKKLDAGVFMFKLTAVSKQKEEINLSGNISLIR